MLFRRDRRRCRNVEGGRDVLDVAAYVDRRGPAVALRLNEAYPPLVLTPNQVGWLRGQLRDQLLDAVEQAERERQRA